MFKSRKQCSINENKFSLSLFYKSPTIYKFLRNILEIILSGVTTVEKCIDNSNVLPSLSFNFLNQFKIKTETLTLLEKYCVVAFDEMKIENYLEYSKTLDLVKGFQYFRYLGKENWLHK